MMTTPLNTKRPRLAIWGGRVYWIQLRLPSQDDDEEEEPLFAE